jgi:hypothetical protein
VERANEISGAVWKWRSGKRIGPVHREARNFRKKKLATYAIDAIGPVTGPQREKRRVHTWLRCLAHDDDDDGWWRRRRRWWRGGGERGKKKSIYSYRRTSGTCECARLSHTLSHPGGKSGSLHLGIMPIAIIVGESLLSNHFNSAGYFSMPRRIPRASL